METTGSGKTKTKQQTEKRIQTQQNGKTKNNNCRKWNMEATKDDKNSAKWLISPNKAGENHGEQGKRQSKDKQKTKSIRRQKRKRQLKLVETT